MSGTTSPQRQDSIGSGTRNDSTLAKRGFSMGSFRTPPSRLEDNQRRLKASAAGARSVDTSFLPGTTGGLMSTTRSGAQGGANEVGRLREGKRTSSQRGNNHRDSMRVGEHQPPANRTTSSLEPVVPLDQGSGRGISGNPRPISRHIGAYALRARTVEQLLNRLTADGFDLVSDRIVDLTNKIGGQEKNGLMLMQVTKLIFEKAKDEAALSEMYARLCRKMMERVSPNVQDQAIRNAEGQPITGGLLFRKYLLNRCQEEFERGWSAKEAGAALAASEAGNDEATKITSQVEDEVVLCSDSSCVVATARRQGLGVVRFIGELFKLQMLTERIMHQCVKMLLSNVVNPEGEKIESLCELLKVVGRSLDTVKARTHMDIYFERIREMSRGNHISSRMKLMLEDIIDLRQRHWEADPAVRPGPSTITNVCEHPKHSTADSSNIIRSTGKLRGGIYHTQQGSGWDVAGGVSAAAGQSPAEAGDLSQFDKISNSAGLSLGLTNVFNNKNSESSDVLEKASAGFFATPIGAQMDKLVDKES
ncbi:hypothetical protein FRC09_020973 [Ceratobasidium sp. 395]|nr:hypothetical protein FRC09_020973 [Ceratobasidium sp. 395]